MSLTTSSNDFSSSPLAASDFLTSALAAGLGGGLDLSRSAPLSAAIFAGSARIASRCKVVSLSLIVRFIRYESLRVLGPLSRSVADRPIQRCKSSMYTGGEQGRRHGSVLTRHCPQI